jgi:hypothetical protein
LLRSRTPDPGCLVRHTSVKGWQAMSVAEHQWLMNAQVRRSFAAAEVAACERCQDPDIFAWLLVAAACADV